MERSKRRQAVIAAYGRVARGGSGCCGDGGRGQDAHAFARSLGYSSEELSRIPEESNLGLSCGNPTALASLREGEVVLDLGSGAGFDAFLAAAAVGASGRVIGVDMTPAMVERARSNAERHGYENVEFRLGEIENLPVADASVDAVISNCVINLSVDKARVFREVVRVLRPGGRVAISDIALLGELPPEIRESLDAYVGCVAGAMHLEEYRRVVEASGLADVRITPKASSACVTPSTRDPIAGVVVERLGDVPSLEERVTSVYIEARKPSGA